MPLVAILVGCKGKAACKADVDELMTFFRAMDHSIAEIYLEAAESDLESNPADAKVASAVVTAVLPRYFAALAPETPESQPAAARATVTRVRWPYT